MTKLYLDHTVLGFFIKIFTWTRLCLSLQLIWICILWFVGLYFLVICRLLLSRGQGFRGKVKGRGSCKDACWDSVGLTCLCSLQRAVLSAVRLTTSLWETRVRATCLPTHSALWPLSCTGSNTSLRAKV